MTTRQLTADPVELDADFDDVSNAIDDNERTEQDILTEIGASEDHADFECRVFQMPETGTKRIWLFNVPGAQAKTILERLRDQYGTGTYEVRIWQTINGKTKPAKNHKQTIAIRRPDNAPLPTAAPSDNALATMVKQQGDALQLMLHRLTTLQATPPAPAPVAPAADPVAMFQQMAAMAKAMRDMTGPPPAAVDPFSMLQSVVSLVKSANDEGRDKTVIEQVMEFANSDVAKMVLQNIQQPQPRPMIAAPGQIQAQPQPQPVQAHTQPPAPVQPQPMQTQAPVTVADDPVTIFTQNLAFLITRAEKGSDPVLYADFVEDNVDANLLVTLLQMPDPVGMLARYNPEVEKHRVWFGELVGALSEGVADDMEPPPLTPGIVPGQMASAHGSDTVSNVAASERAASSISADANSQRSGGSS